MSVVDAMWLLPPLYVKANELAVIQIIHKGLNLDLSNILINICKMYDSISTRVKLELVICLFFRNKKT